MTEPDTASEGFGLAGFLISLHTIRALLRKGSLDMTEVHELIAAAKAHVSECPGHPAAVHFAETALGLAEQLAATAVAEKPPAGPH